MDTLEKLVTIDELQEMLGCSRGYVYKHTYTREWPCYKIGARTLFDPDEIEKLVLKTSRKERVA